MKELKKSRFSIVLVRGIHSALHAKTTVHTSESPDNSVGLRTIRAPGVILKQPTFQSTPQLGKIKELRLNDGHLTPGTDTVFSLYTAGNIPHQGKGQVRLFKVLCYSNKVINLRTTDDGHDS
jgi:hypothetical protein